MVSAPTSPSIVGSPRSTTSILTPTRKVQALLAHFSETESENDAAARPRQIHDVNTEPREIGGNSAPTNVPEESEDDDILVPRRLPATKHTNNDTADQPQNDNNNSALGSGSRLARMEMDKLFSRSEEDSTPGPPSPTRNMAATSGSGPPSPLFFPSPEGRKSKFLALVEKHRKERKAKEAEESDKRELQLQSSKSQDTKRRRPRGSSPADDTDEDSGVSEATGGTRLSKQARPTRKASKKALEEMNRETQRISRNMQLAHQARTEKRITKDSLLARFNLPTAVTRAGRSNELSATSSSRAPSEDEAKDKHDTPPTSPIADITTPKIDKGKRRALSVEPVDHAVQVSSLALPGSDQLDEQPLKPTVKPSREPDRSKFPSSVQIWSDNDDSDSDLEVITSRANKRKYAAFEHLHTKKAKETSSHIALRSLANLIGEDRKRSVNAAAAEASLRKAARMQARQERQQRIDELKAKGVVIQTAEDREREQQEVEDLLERARQEATEIQKREKAVAKKEGNYTENILGEDSSDDEDFTAEDGDDEDGDSEQEDDDRLEETDGDDAESVDDGENGAGLLEKEAEVQGSAGALLMEDAVEIDDEQSDESPEDPSLPINSMPRIFRKHRIVSDDEDEPAGDRLRSPQLPSNTKTPQSLTRSAKKQIPGLQMSDDLPIGLTQAFAATMGESQSQDLSVTQEQDSLQMTADLPSPHIVLAPKLYRLDSIDMISDSQPASQTQPLNINLSFTQSQMVPHSPVLHMGVSGLDATPSQPHFELTQDAGYVMSPFMGNRFATETPQQQGPHSSVDTVIMPENVQDSPIVQRKARLMRGRVILDISDDKAPETKGPLAFEVMQRAALKNSLEAFDIDKSRAREAVDEAAAESEDEYAGLGGASDDDVNDEENEEDRRMIDDDTEVGVGDEAKLAKLFADRERQQDEAAVSKLMKDITTGALRRKRGNDDLDLSDEEDATIRRREVKRRDYAKMRRELLKDEAVGKIAEDKKKEAFLRSIEDRLESDDEDDFSQTGTQPEEDSQTKDSQSAGPYAGLQHTTDVQSTGDNTQPLATAAASRLNQNRETSRRSGVPLNKRPGTLAEIRESVSFLIEEPDSRAGTIDLGLSDSEDEPEAYVDLDRHVQVAEADENAEDADDLGDFIVDDDEQAQYEVTTFKKPALPTPETRAPFSERRTKERVNVVNRLSMLRQGSSSSSASSTTKIAFYTATSSASSSFSKVPTLLRRATTNSSLGSMAGNETVSATGVVTNKTERGRGRDDKEFVRKASGGRSMAVNYRPTVREEKMSQRAGIAKKSAAKGKKSGFLGGLFDGGSWA